MVTGKNEDGNNNNSTYLNNEALNRMNKSKTQSTAAHGSVKNNMDNSFDDMGSFDVNKQVNSSENPTPKSDHNQKNNGPERKTESDGNHVKMTQEQKREIEMNEKRE